MLILLELSLLMNSWPEQVDSAVERTNRTDAFYKKCGGVLRMGGTGEMNHPHTIHTQTVSARHCIDIKKREKHREQIT